MALEEKLMGEELNDAITELELYRREFLAKSLFFVGMRNSHPDVHFGTAISLHAVCSLDLKGYSDISFKEFLWGGNENLKHLMADKLFDVIEMNQDNFDKFLEEYPRSERPYDHHHPDNSFEEDKVGIAMTLVRTIGDNKRFFAECKSKVDSNLTIILNRQLNFLNNDCLTMEESNTSAITAYQQAATMFCFALNLCNLQLQINDEERAAMVSYLNSRYSAGRAKEAVVSGFKQIISHAYNKLPYPNGGKVSELRGSIGGFPYSITPYNLEEELLWRIKFLLPYRVEFYTKLRQSISSGKARDLNELLEISSLSMSYEPIQILGTGKGGTVYLVCSPELKSTRAIKIIRLAFDHKEAELLAKIQGQDLENLVQVHEAGTHLVAFERKPVYSIVMEYVDGQTLEEILKERKLTPHEVLDYSAQILNGIQSLRKYGITHRDLNLRNIKVNSQGEVKILDFGIATDEPHPESKDNRKYGAPRNMEADDLISFGLLVYRMIAGEHLVDVSGKETIGSDTYADEIDKTKSFLYHQGKIAEEYRKKIQDISQDVYNAEHDEYEKYSPDESMHRHFLEFIILSALEGKDLERLKNLHPLPHRYKLMDAKELRRVLYSEHVTGAMKRGKLELDLYLAEIKLKENGA